MLWRWWAGDAPTERLVRAHRFVTAAIDHSRCSIMNRRLRTSLILTRLSAPPGAVSTQPGVNVARQAGVSVQMPVTSNAVAVPKADNQDALVVALTAEGTSYLGVDRLETSALAD